jgi:outer membrane protein assembly factor BamB
MAPWRSTGTGAEAELPEYVGHYRLESCLGSGGMGVVHLAHSPSGMKVAVKVVHADFARDPEFRGRFRQEVAAARRVSGAFTAPVVDADPQAERPWMATQFIPGPTLAEEVKRNGPMAPAHVRRLMAGLAEALRDIHRVGVVHRDLKPSNVLLAEDGPKVIDFGISRPKDSDLRTETGKLIGTPPFMAPEQFRRPREVGPAADIFALGSVMVHAATGRGPFDSDSPYVVAYQVVHDDPDLSDVPDDLAPLVLRCLAKEPEDRPTPDELLRELRSVAASYDTQAFIPAQRPDDGPAPHPRPERPGPSVGKRAGRKLAAGAGALALLAVAGVAAVQVMGGGESPPAAASPRTGAASSTSWAAKPVTGGRGMPQCSYGEGGGRGSSTGGSEGNDGGKVVCARSGVVFALSPVDGRLLWRHPVATGLPSGPPAVAAARVLHASGDALTALDPGSGDQVWRRHLAQGTAVRYAGRTALLVGSDGTVTGVDERTGGTKWTRRITGYSTPAVVSFAGDPLAYATSTSPDGTRTLVAAVDPATGAVRWKARLAGELKPVASGRGSLFFLSADRTSGQTRAVVRYTPASKASRRVALPVPRVAPQAGAHGDVVHILAAGGSLEAVDLDTGKRLWHLETAVSRGSAPVGDGAHVYFTGADGRLLAVDARSGRLLGQTPPRLGANAGAVPAALPAPLVVGGHVYAAAPDGTVFGVDARDPSDW